MTYLCVYCTEKLSTFSLIVQHLMEQHHDKEIKFKLPEGKLLRTLNFKIIPELCREQCRTITINKESETIHVSKPNVIPKESPLKKIVMVTNKSSGHRHDEDVDFPPMEISQMIDLVPFEKHKTRCTFKMNCKTKLDSNFRNLQSVRRFQPCTM